MKFTFGTQGADAHIADCLVVAIYEQGELSLSAKQINAVTSNKIQDTVTAESFSGKVGDTLLLNHLPGLQSPRVLLVGAGQASKLNSTAFRKVLNSVFSTLKQKPYDSLGYYLTELAIKGHDKAWNVREAVMMMEQCCYEFGQYKTEHTPINRLKNLFIHADSEQDLTLYEQACTEGQAIAHGIKLTKDLGNQPSNTCTPSYLAEQAHQMSNEYKQLKLNVIDEKSFAKMGMHSFLSVAKGSDEPGKLIVLEYNGADKSISPTALVGKGITFDSGGISIKPGAAMDEMKYDMGGAAAVLGAMQTIAELQLPINVVAVIAAAENMPGGGASKPGDIVKSLSGQTIEILNTDAEGRLVLCDALTYVQQEYKPAKIIDLATLTGAMIIALGHLATGLFSNNDELAEQLKAAANQTDDKVWQFPIWDEYQQGLDSNFADMANIASDRGAGSIMAACFLSRFTKETPWVHLDIAGTAWNSGKNKGSTGRPVSLLAQFFLNQAQQMQQSQQTQQA